MKKGLVSPKELKELYEKDFALWAELNAQLLREGHFELLDVENLAEEIEDMARSELRSCISYLVVIMVHMYKWDHFRHLTKGGTQKGGFSWVYSVENARSKIRAMLKRQPSLKAKLPAEVEYAWELAVGDILEEVAKLGVRLKRKDLPQNCPYTYEELMERDLEKELEELL